LKAVLLIIGDEVLNGNTLDTNSNFAAGLFRENGIHLSNIITVGDSRQEIIDGLEYAFSRGSLVISTGGLGPTKDDITKATVAEYFNTTLTLSNEVLETIRDRYEKRGIPMTKLNENQALVPVDGKYYINPVGSAPIFRLKKEDKTYFALPGVPREMQYLLEHIVLPELKNEFMKEIILQENIMTIGIAESVLASQLYSIEELIEEANTLDHYFKLAYLPQLMKVKLQLTARGKDEAYLTEKITEFKNLILPIAGEFVYAKENITIEEAIGNLLKERNATISCVESCTGGYISHLLTKVPGSSSYYHGSLISYDNRLKTGKLKINTNVIETKGAVSKECCFDMTSGGLEFLETTYILATTGIAGPTGGSDEKPVGTVWIGVGNKDRIETRRFLFSRSREENIHIFAITALDQLRRFILGLPLRGEEA